MTVEQLESSEAMGPTMKGIIEELDTRGATYSQIRGEDGRIYRFFFGTCVGKIDTFNDLKVGMSVTFNNFIGTRKIMGADPKDVKFGLVAVNVAIDTSERTETLVPEVKTAVAQAVARPTESNEAMSPQVRGIVKAVKMPLEASSFGFITPENGKDVMFNIASLKSFDPSDKSREKINALVEELNNFPEGMRVRFNIEDTKKGPFVRNLEADVSGEGKSE